MKKYHVFLKQSEENEQVRETPSSSEENEQARETPSSSEDNEQAEETVR